MSVEKLLERHIEQDRVDHAEIKSLVKGVSDKMDTLHSKLDENTKETTANRTDINWLKWGFLAVAGSVIAYVVNSLLKLV